MEKLKPILPFYGLIAVVFYIVPLLIRDTGSAMLIVLIVMPAAVFLISVTYGLKENFSWFYPIVSCLMFIPCIFIHFNSTALSYVIPYSCIIVFGSTLGKVIKRVSGRFLQKENHNK